DPVGEIEQAALETLRQHPHDQALQREWTVQLPVDERRRGEIGDELGKRAVDRREELEQLAQARDGVVCGQELREDVAAADRTGKNDVVLGRRLREVRERRRRADDLELAALQQVVHL